MRFFQMRFFSNKVPTDCRKEAQIQTKIQHVWTGGARPVGSGVAGAIRGDADPRESAAVPPQLQHPPDDAHADRAPAPRPQFPGK